MADLAGANSYFAERLKSEAWEAASDADKSKALATAERQLEPYRTRTDPTSFAFAVYEQAIWLLQADKRAELQQAGVISAGIGDVSETYRPRHDPNIAPKAWMFIRGVGPRAGDLR